MSAFMQSTKHIDALVRVICEGPSGVGSGLYHPPYYSNPSRKACLEEGSRIGVILMRENALSVNHRYPNHPPMVSMAHYMLFRALGERLAVVPALKALDGYEYQSCEHEGWPKSEAYDLVYRTRKALIRCLPGYEGADTWAL